MNVLIAYSEEFDQLNALRQFFKAKKVKIDERITDFGSFPIQDVLKYDLLIIQNQLNQDVSDPAAIKSNPGLEIVRELRANHHSGIPVLLVSEKSLNKFERDLEESIAPEKSTDHALFMIYSPGFKIYSLEDAEWNMEEILKMKPLSSALVTDVCEMLLDLKGYLIDKVTHKLNYIPKEKDSQNTDEIEEDLKLRLDWVRSFLNKFFTPGEIIRIEFDQSEEHLIRAQLEFESEEYETVRSALRDNIEREVGKRKNDISDKPNEKRFKILLLDDDPSWLKNIIKPLNRTFELVTTAEASEALSILDQDPSNEIVAVISDWRLYKDFGQQTYWQEIQGYDVLQYAARTGHRALIALTSLTDSVIHKIRNHLDVNISLITKDYIRAEENAAFLRSIILDKCIEIDLQIASTPTSKGWFNGGEQSLHNQYIELRSSGDWAVTEHEISKTADEVFEYYMQGTDIDIQRSLEPVNKKFGLKLQQKGIYIVENCLIVRRVWLGLWWNLNKFNFPYALDDYPEVKIFSTIRQSYLDEEGDNVRDGLEKLANNAKQLAYNLGFVKEELPLNGILPEEKSWLKRHNIDPKKGNISVYEIE